jgi:pseudouridylate synthase
VIETRLSDEVADALSGGRAIVALESTIFSHLGLPSPANAEALERCTTAIRSGGAVPAVTAVLDGVARVGLGDAEHERILGTARKVAERDLAVALAQRWDFGATTVSASVALAAHAGVSVFATGGIGGRAPGCGAHRRHQCRPRRDGEPPGHHRVSRSEGVPRPAPHARVPGDGRCAGARLAPRRLPGVLHPVVRACGSRTGSSPRRRWPPSSPTARDRRRGVLVAVPIPEADALDAELDAVLAQALADCESAGIAGAAVTPFVLGRIGEATAGRSVPANLALAENNARVAAEIAVAVAALTS